MLPSTMRQKIFRIGFWFLLFYIAITSTVVIAIQFQLIPVPERSLAKADTDKKTEQPKLSEASFAKQFAREYLSWTKENKNNYLARLAPFFPDSKKIGDQIDFEEAIWNSYPQNVEVWKIEDRPESKDGIKEITVYAETYLTKVDDQDTQKRIDRYIVIPIKRSGASFFVVDMPRFIAPPVASPLPKETDEKKSKGETVDLSVKEQVEDFLTQSFWPSYTSDSSKNISYLMKGNQSISTLSGIMKFIESKRVDVYKNQDHYLVETDVLLQDAATNTKIFYRYQLKLVKEKDRWFVLEIKQGEGSK